MPKTEATLRVVEALQQDVSYGRARLDGQTRVELNLSPGDIIEIKGHKTTAAVVWRSHPGDEGKGIIHVDNLTRKNAGVSIGDKVTIKKAEVKPAKQVTLAPAISQDQQIQFGDGIDALAKRGLDRKSTRLNSSHGYISYAVFCLKKKKKIRTTQAYKNGWSVTCSSAA